MTFVATPIADSARPAPPRVLVSQLQGVAAARGASELAQRLGELDRWIGAELRDFDSALATVPRGVRAVQAAAHHLLDLGGKHLRPMCVALASRSAAAGFDDRARQLAIAVELVHTATLLHDDVVDLSRHPARPAERARDLRQRRVDLRRRLAPGRGAAAHPRHRRPGLLDGMLGDHRGDDPRRVAAARAPRPHRRRRRRLPARGRGQDRGLFRWAMGAGARAGGCTPTVVAALESTAPTSASASRSSTTASTSPATSRSPARRCTPTCARAS
jgi:octaprenyl-diphosphate synthase